MKKILKFTIIWLVIVLLLEVFVFNIKFWITIGNEEKNLSDYSITWSRGIVYDAEEDVYHIKDPYKDYFMIKGIDEHINSICLDVHSADMQEYRDAYNALTVEIIAEDEANSKGLDLGAADIYPDVPGTMYKTVHLSGESKFVKLNCYANNIVINDIIINPNIPFSFKWIRMLILFAVGMIIYAFRPKSSLYSRKLFDGFDKKNAVVVLGSLLACVIIALFVGFSDDPKNTLEASTTNNIRWPVYESYNDLADMLLHGQTSMSLEPPKKLAEITNPYDGGMRYDAVGESFALDYAYYNGKYYSYFGVVPALLAYAPVLIITGHGISTWKIVLLMTILTIFAIYAFTYEFCRKYFPNVSVAVYTLATVFMCISSSWIYLVFLGIVYSVPIIFSLFFAILGLTFWMRSTRDKKINKLWLVLGSICIALLLGCRAQFILVAVFAVAIFWDETIKERIFFSKKGLVNTILVIAPFIVVGVGIMFYNYIRFDSPFDFGATYNLTSNDMTHRGTVLSRIPLGIFTYLFLPFTMSGKFPYLMLCKEENDYLGFTNYEPLLGGALFYNCLFILLILIFRLSPKLKKNKVRLFSWVAIALGFVIMNLDIQMAGLTQRYQSDFCWLFAIATLAIIFTLEQCTEANKATIFVRRNVLLFGVLLTVFFNVWSIFIYARFFCMRDCNPELFYSVKEMVEFY